MRWLLSTPHHFWIPVNRKGMSKTEKDISQMSWPLLKSFFRNHTNFDLRLPSSITSPNLAAKKKKGWFKIFEKVPLIEHICPHDQNLDSDSWGRSGLDFALEWIYPSHCCTVEYVLRRSWMYNELSHTSQDPTVWKWSVYSFLVVLCSASWSFTVKRHSFHIPSSSHVSQPCAICQSMSRNTLLSFPIVFKRGQV